MEFLDMVFLASGAVSLGMVFVLMTDLFPFLIRFFSRLINK